MGLGAEASTPKWYERSGIPEQVTGTGPTALHLSPYSSSAGGLWESRLRLSFRASARRINSSRQRRQREPARLPEFRVHRDRGEAGKGVQLVDQNPVGPALQEEVDARHPRDAAEEEGLDGEPPDLVRHLSGTARGSGASPCRRGTCRRSRRTRGRERSRPGPTPGAPRPRAPRTRARARRSPPRRAPARRSGRPRPGRRRGPRSPSPSRRPRTIRPSPVSRRAAGGGPRRRSRAAPARSETHDGEPRGRNAGARSRDLKTALSIPIADPVTPAPTYGIPRNSRNPWRVPSSPVVPWMIGKTTSARPGEISSRDDAPSLGLRARRISLGHGTVGEQSRESAAEETDRPRPRPAG